MIIVFIRRKKVLIICTDRIQEIDPSEEAVFDITIKNPTRKQKTYTISSKIIPPNPKWQTATDRDELTIQAKQTAQIILVVKPDDIIEPNDWTEAVVQVRVKGKKKSKEISTMTMIKEGKTILRITDVFTWPKSFSKGDRIVTSFKLENTGTLSARNVHAVLYINGKEKNKVEVTIPHGGYADIKLPWIALKGKNDLMIKAIEQ